jgi:hypothetical protein
MALPTVKISIPRPLSEPLFPPDSFPEPPVTDYVLRFRSTNSVAKVGDPLPSLDDLGPGGLHLTAPGDDATRRPLVERTAAPDYAKYILFDGANDSLTALWTRPTGASLSIVSALIVPPAAASPGVFLTTASNRGIKRFNGNLEVAATSPAVSGGQLAAAAGPHFVATTYAAATAGGVTTTAGRLYVDGAAGGEVALGAITAGASFNIGSAGGGGSPSATGLFEELVFDRVLSAGEIADLRAWMKEEWPLP